MAADTATVTMPITAHLGKKTIRLGDLVLDVKVVNGRVRPPTEREIKAALKRSLR